MERQHPATVPNARRGDAASTQTVMNDIDGYAFEWAMQAHLQPPTGRGFDRDFAWSQYRILRDHLELGKDFVDFIPLRAEFAGYTATELDHSIWEKYHQFCQQLLRETIRAGLTADGVGSAPA